MGSLQHREELGTQREGGVLQCTKELDRRPFVQDRVQDMDILKVPRVEGRNNHDYSGLCHGGGKWGNRQEAAIGKEGRRQ